MYMSSSWKKVALKISGQARFTMQSKVYSSHCRSSQQQRVPQQLAQYKYQYSKNCRVWDVLSWDKNNLWVYTFIFFPPREPREIVHYINNLSEDSERVIWKKQITTHICPILWHGMSVAWISIYCKLFHNDSWFSWGCFKQNIPER